MSENEWQDRGLLIPINEESRVYYQHNTRSPCRPALMVNIVADSSPEIRALSSKVLSDFSSNWKMCDKEPAAEFSGYRNSHRDCYSQIHSAPLTVDDSPGFEIPTINRISCPQNDDATNFDLKEITLSLKDVHIEKENVAEALPSSRHRRVSFDTLPSPTKIKKHSA